MKTQHWGKQRDQLGLLWRLKPCSGNTYKQTLSVNQAYLAKSILTITQAYWNVSGADVGFTTNQNLFSILSDMKQLVECQKILVSAKQTFVRTQKTCGVGLWAKRKIDIPVDSLRLAKIFSKFVWDQEKFSKLTNNSGKWLQWIF